MKSKSPGTNKITQIICISNDYVSHRKNLTKVRGLVDHSTKKRNSDISGVLSQQANYRSIYKAQEQRSLQEQN